MNQDSLSKADNALLEISNLSAGIKYTLLGDMDNSLKKYELFQTNPERFVRITLPFKPNLQSKPSPYLFHVPEKADKFGLSLHIYEIMTSHIIIGSLNSIFEDTFLSISLIAELLSNNKVIILSKERITILVTRNKSDDKEKRSISLNFFNGIRLTHGNLIVKKTIVTLKDHFKPVYKDKESEEIYKESIKEKILNILMGFFEGYREKHLSPQEIIQEQIKILKYVRQP